jgi:hypothetical protein
MPNKKSVIWLNSPNEIAAKIKYGLNNSVEIVANAQNGLYYCGENPTQASQQI